MTYLKMDVIDEDDMLPLKLEHIIDFGYGTEQEFAIGYDFFNNQEDLNLLSWARFIAYDLSFETLEEKCNEAF